MLRRVLLILAVLGSAALLPHRLEAQYCEKACANVTNENGDVVGHGCVTVEEGEGEFSCTATTSSCGEVECSGGGVVALSEVGLPAGILDGCPERGFAVVAALDVGIGGALITRPVSVAEADR